MKPILFNTEMVCAILDGRKKVTRRVVKPKPNSEQRIEYCEPRKEWTFMRGWALVDRVINPPYRTGDILYVRETFCKCCLTENARKGHSDYCYKASIKSPVYGCINCYTEGDVCKWKPSIHMPREAARIFLRVTDVRVERLQEITDSDIIAEGVQSKKPEWLRLDFADLWNSTLKASDLHCYGWDASPWVWVIEFERISREGVENAK